MAAVELFGADVERMRDPRLRAMMLLDLKALVRAMAVNDNRMSTVHLGGLFEAMVIDVALHRRNELALRGSPDSWQLQQLVPAILGGRFMGSDRNTLFQIINCKNLIRPAVQLLNPIVVTSQTVGKIIEFVDRFVEATGLASDR